MSERDLAAVMFNVGVIGLAVHYSWAGFLIGYTAMAACMLIACAVRKKRR